LKLAARSFGAPFRRSLLIAISRQTLRQQYVRCEMIRCPAHLAPASSQARLIRSDALWQAVHPKLAPRASNAPDDDRSVWNANDDNY